LLTACNTTRFLKGDQVYLSKNSVQFAKDQEGQIANKSNLAYEMANLAVQKPNEKFFAIPRQYFYFHSMDTVGRNKVGLGANKFLREKIGENPIFYDENLAQASVERLKNYMFERGYFHNDVSFYTRYKRKGQKVEVIYVIEPNGQSIVDTMRFETKDTAIQKSLAGISNKSRLSPGAPVDANLYEQEVNRVYQHLRNDGYAYFLPQYISKPIARDTGGQGVNIRLEIAAPKGDSIHRKYTIGDITIYPESKAANFLTVEPDTIIDGVYFVTGGQPFGIKPRVLLRSVLLEKGEMFRQSDVNDTYRRLNSLGVFSFVNINYEPDPEQEGVLNFKIYLTANKKWAFGFDGDWYLSERNIPGGNQNLLGLSLNPSLQNRNFRNKAELLVMNVDLGLELAPFADTNVINTLDFKVQFDWNFPRFEDYFRLYRGLKNLKLMSQKNYDELRSKATSRLSSGYNQQILINRYQLYISNVSYGFTMQRTVRSRLDVNNFGIDVLIPIVQPQFQVVLDENLFLERSFQSQLITGFLFKDLSFIATTKPSLKGHFWRLNGELDLSGLEIWSANKIYNAAAKKDTKFQLFEADFAQYIKIEADLRRYWTITRERSFVARLNMGIAVPFGFAETVPYVKQFFVGGPQSLRGWNARAIGPGSFLDPLTLDQNSRNLFYQTGDFKIETNFEYRFPIVDFFGKINGAFFIDAGNIWSLGVINEEERPGSTLVLQRTTNEDGVITNDLFLKEFAISGGVGMRWDLTYFIFRLDLGTPIKNNYPDFDRGNSYWVDFSKWNFSNVVWNIGLGYPF
jgi:outer membrane protein insertion porin family